MSRPLRLPALTVTTRHSAAVYPWQHCQTLPGTGVPIGVNALAGGTLLRYDPWECYAAGVITSPNMMVAGQLGRGKSALVKTYLHRQLLRGRQVFILDPKGEYTALAAAHDLAVIRLRPGGDARLNPLDPPPGVTAAERVASARATVTATLAGTGTGLGHELSGEQRAGLAAAIHALPVDAVLADVVHMLLHPTEAMSAALSTTADALAAALRPVAIELHRLLAGDLAGMVDGTTTVALDPQGPGVVVDLSAVVNTDAQATVMVCAGAWLAAALDADTDRRRLLLVDEGWALLARSSTTRWLQQMSKLARAHGVQLVTVIHRFSDLAAQTDVGTAAHAQAKGLLADAETRVLYGQAPGEKALASELLDLTRAEADLVCTLGPYRALWRIGERTAVVDHVLTERERALVDTDVRMRP